MNYNQEAIEKLENIMNDIADATNMAEVTNLSLTMEKAAAAQNAVQEIIDTITND